MVDLDHCDACWHCVPNYAYMRLCSICGNKRCPHANNHRLDCTGSNEPGQSGSAYPALSYRLP